jgi:hypothetical protein
MSNALTRTTFWAALAIGAVFVAGETAAQAQQLRSPNNSRSKALLLPPNSPGILNNGSLQTTQNPQGGFSYTATMQLGDRLGNNGVFYDTNLLPNAGLFQGGQFLGQLNNNNNNYNTYSGYGGSAYGFSGGFGFGGIVGASGSFGSGFGVGGFGGGGGPAQQQYLYLLLLQQQYMIQQLQQQQTSPAPAANLLWR